MSLQLNPKRPDFHRTDQPRNRIVVDSFGAWLHSEYDEGFVEAIKATFKYHDRYWSPERTAWRVEGEHLIREAIGLFKTFYPEGTVIDER